MERKVEQLSDYRKNDLPEFPTEQMKVAFFREFTAPGNFERAYVAMVRAWKEQNSKR